MVATKSLLRQNWVIVASFSFLTSAIAWADNCITPTMPLPPLSSALRQTVVITDPNVLNDPNVDFSLGHTLGKIIQTTGSPDLVDTPAERISFLTTLIRSFRDRFAFNPDSNFSVPIAQLLGEAQLDPIALLNKIDPNGMRVVGLFNRFDLAPADFKYCGEYRIVYEKGNPVGATDRFTLIFEAALDNPQPTLGEEGCRPIVEFWDSLKAQSGATLAKSLSKFYYDGLNANIQPAVHLNHYGHPFGQVRANLFVNTGAASHPWQLREYFISFLITGAPTFFETTDKVSPFFQLYRDPTAGEDKTLTALRQQFQNDFPTLLTPQLTDVDKSTLGGTSQSAQDILFKLGTAVSNKYNGFESQSQIDQDDPEAHASATMRNAIKSSIDRLGMSSSCQLTADHILNRAGALSCGGCHQFSAGKPIAAGVNWPSSLGFVHIDEHGNLSPALVNFFLPSRQQNLARHVQKPAFVADVSVPQAEIESTLSQIRSVREQAATIGGISDFESRSKKIAELQTQIEALRASDRSTPGAFVSIRRSH